MFAQIISVLSAIPQILGAIKALIGFVREMTIKRKQDELTKVEEDIKNAKTEDDFRNAADRLSKSGD
jgi:phosphopantothenate synthetase